MSHKINIRETRGRIVLLFFYEYTESFWKHSGNRRILEEFTKEENLYIGLAAYPKWKAGTLSQITKRKKKQQKVQDCSSPKR